MATARVVNIMARELNRLAREKNLAVSVPPTHPPTYSFTH